MAALLAEPPVLPGRLRFAGEAPDAGNWLVFRYASVSLFSLKSSRATSTAGKTLLTPTPYAAKMAFLDTALRHGLTADPTVLVRWLAAARLRIGMPRNACVTGTIQSVRQETRDLERRRKPNSPPYRGTIAVREVVHFEGSLRLAFDLKTSPVELVPLLVEAAPAINYFGKRGSFFQYVSGAREPDLDASFTRPVDDKQRTSGAPGQRAILDDFGAHASFEALNSFAPTEARRNIDRSFIETVVPMEVHNAGPGFVHYRLSGAIL